MKKILLLIGFILLLSGCSSETKIKDTEAYCTSFGEMCSQESQEQNVCEICGVTKVSSYASCHSKEFCKNTPME
jgi:uncharacterized protein YceK